MLGLIFRSLCLVAALSGVAHAAVTPQLAAGADHSLALRDDGKVFAWGDDGSGQLGTARAMFQSTPARVVWPNAYGIAAVSAGAYHSLARTRDGQLLSWGHNGEGQLGDGTLLSHGVPLRVGGLPPVTAMAAGEQHTLAAVSDGTVWAWGSNEFGRLGVGNTELDKSLLPVMVEGLSAIQDVRAGRAHSLALTQTGEVRAWGSNTAGQLGDSTGRTRYAPVAVDFGQPAPVIVAIHAAADHSFALDNQGRLWTWGDNTYYQLGESSYSLRSFPLYLTALEAAGRVSQFSAGPAGGAAVLEDGSLWVWGFYGRYTTPTRIDSLPGPAARVHLGEGHTVVTLRDGQVITAGDNQLGQLGNGSTNAPDEWVFVTPPGLETGATSVAAGYYHTLALTSQGGFWGWGDNSRGQLGNGVETTRSVPREVTGLSQVTQIAAGHRHSLALRADGTVWAWGDNDEGALGGGSEARISTVPTASIGLPPIRQIAAAGASSAALDHNGQLWAWGANLRGQLAISADIYRTATPTRADGLPSLQSVAVGAEHMLGLASDGRVWVWGANGYGQLGDDYDQRTTPRALGSLTGIRAVAASGDHSLALDSQGRVWAWGDNGYRQSSPSDTPQVKVPVQVSGLPAIQAIAAGYWTSYALGTDGRIWAWGSGNEGQLGTGVEDIVATPAPAQGEHFSQVAPGGAHALALRSDGLVWAFGLDASGQLGDGRFVNQSRPGAIVDPALTGLFDLRPQEPKLAIAPGQMPPFFLQTQKIGADSLLSLRTRLRLQSAASPSAQRQGTRATLRYDLYVAAVVPGSHQAGVWVKNESANWEAYLPGGPLGAYLRNVSSASDQDVLIDILDSTDLSSLPGTQFYVGYGTSAEEMLASGRVRMVYQVRSAR